MIDLKYYANVALNNKEERDIFLKLLSGKRFKSLQKASYYYKNIQSLDNDYISRFENKTNLVEIANKFSLGLESHTLDPFKFLNDKVFPSIDFSSLLNEFSPVEKNSHVLLECPCCKDDKKDSRTFGNRDAFIVKSGGSYVGTIKCSRESNCGETTSIFSYVKNRENLSFMETMNYLASSVGLDYDAHVRNSEMHIEDKGNFRDDSIAKEKTQLNVAEKQKDPLGLYPIDFKKADTSLSFNSNINLLKLKHKYSELKESTQLQMIYTYIKNFTLRDKDKSSMVDYFKNRGIAEGQLKDVGYLKANEINTLVNELKELFGDDELVKHGILTEKAKKWKYTLETKDKDYVYNDSAVFFMHDIYNDVPTNMEFKFFGEKTIGSKRKAVSMAKSEVIDSNYYGNANNIDVIKDDKVKMVWSNEGAIDCKTLEHFNIHSFSLIGVGKHFNENLGWYKDKIFVIAFDEDKAGIKNNITFAKKLKKAGVEHIFFASWDEKYGNDLNDLLKSRNIDKINLSYATFTLDKNNEYVVSSDITKVQKINENVIKKGYEKAFPTVETMNLEDYIDIKKKLINNASSNSEARLSISDLVSIERDEEIEENTSLSP